MATPALLLRASPGLRYMAASALFFSLMSLSVKLAGQRMPTMELVFTRALVVALLAWIDLRRRGVGLAAGDGRLLLLRGLVGFTALTCFYYSVIHLPLAEATVIHFTNPVFTALVAAVVLRERVRRAELLLALASLTGVIVIVRPAGLLGGTTLPPLPVATALAGSLLAAFAYVLVRQLRRHDAMLIVFYFAAISVLVAAPLMAPVFVMPQGAEWAVLAGVGVTTFLGQTFMTRGLQLERAGRATAVGYLQIVFASLWGALFLNQLPGLATFLGAAIIVVSTLGLARTRERAEPPAKLE